MTDANLHRAAFGVVVHYLTERRRYLAEADQVRETGGGSVQRDTEAETQLLIAVRHASTYGRYADGAAKVVSTYTGLPVERVLADATARAAEAKL